MTEVTLPRSRRKHGDGDVHRRCGDCTACCTVMGVDDYDTGRKPGGVTCPDVCSRGCRRYATRPQTCRDFACLWVQGGLPKWMKPDRVGVVFSADVVDGHQVLFGHIDARVGDRWLKNYQLVTYFAALSERGLTIVLGTAGPDGSKVTHQFKNGRLLVRPPEASQPDGRPEASR